MKRSVQRLGSRSALGLTRVLVALFLIGYLASFFHEVTVRHTLCAEHGEWIHETATLDQTEVCERDLGSAPHVRSTQKSSVAPHDHCSIVVASRESRSAAPTGAIALPNFARALGVVAHEPGALPQDERVSTSFARGPPSIV
jgi:hypothetical protein